MSHPHHAALAPLGWSPSRQAELDALGRPAAIPARVGRVDRGSSVAVTAAGPVRVEASGLVAGDWIALEDGRLAAVLTRRTLLARRAAGRPDAEQAIAANIDVVAVVHGLDRPLRDRRLHRALALAWDSGATPVVVLTKADLDAGAAARALDAEVAFGVNALPVSARTGEGLGRARRPRPPRPHAGADRRVRRREVHARQRPRRARGARDRRRPRRRPQGPPHHHRPPPGAAPRRRARSSTPPASASWASGGREVGVQATFADIAALAEGCRFADCRHDGEPGCAVAAAVADGSLDAGRLDSHRDLVREMAALARRDDERAWRAHGRQGSRMAREAARHKRGGRRGGR